MDLQVINRDIKPSNILVDHNFVAKLSDFGLAHMGPESDSSHVTTRVCLINHQIVDPCKDNLQIHLHLFHVYRECSKQIMGISFHVFIF